MERRFRILYGFYLFVLYKFKKKTGYDMKVNKDILWFINTHRHTYRELVILLKQRQMFAYYLIHPELNIFCLGLGKSILNVVLIAKCVLN